MKSLRDNHLGDWGTQFGILLFAIKSREISFGRFRRRSDRQVGRSCTGREMPDIKEDENALVGARQELVKLQDGDRRKFKTLGKNSGH